MWLDISKSERDPEGDSRNGIEKLQVAANAISERYYSQRMEEAIFLFLLLKK